MMARARMEFYDGLAGPDTVAVSNKRTGPLTETLTNSDKFYGHGFSGCRYSPIYYLFIFSPFI